MFCRSGQASQRGQEGCRSGQGRWSRQSPRRGSNTESNRYRSSTNTESNTNADAANMQYTSENRIVADSNISEVALPYFRFSATVFGNIWWISFSDLNARKSQKINLETFFSASSSQPAWWGELGIGSGELWLHSWWYKNAGHWHWRMVEPYQKDNKRREEYERDEDNDSKSVIFVHRPNFNADEILKR